MPGRPSIQHVAERIKHPMVMAEVGVSTGTNAIQLLKYNVKKLYLIDPYLPYDDGGDKERLDAQVMSRNKEGLIKRIETHPLRKRVEIIFKKSVDAARLFQDEYFDYVYIDGSHDYKDVSNDLKVWFPKVKKGGYLTGHDYNSVNRVSRAVDEFCESQRLKVKTWEIRGKPTTMENSDWLIEKGER